MYANCQISTNSLVSFFEQKEPSRKPKVGTYVWFLDDLFEGIRIGFHFPCIFFNTLLPELSPTFLSSWNELNDYWNYLRGNGCGNFFHRWNFRVNNDRSRRNFSQPRVSSSYQIDFHYVSTFHVAKIHCVVFFHRSM